MKIIYYVLLITSTSSISCPTCVGRVSQQSAPFFSEECYQQKKKIACKKDTSNTVKLNMKPAASHKKQGE